MDMSKFLPPLGFGVKNLRFIQNSKNENESFWIADVKAKRMGSEAHVFEHVWFFEQEGNAAIYGIENENGYPLGLRDDLALKQQAFIQFLRDENLRVHETLGLVAKIFSGNEYSQQGLVLAAYIVQRGVKLNMGVGYKDDETGEYVLEAINPEEDGANNWIEDAKSRLSFDELD